MKIANTGLDDPNFKETPSVSAALLLFGHMDNKSLRRTGDFVQFKPM
jgi:hypothetical protein